MAALSVSCSELNLVFDGVFMTGSTVNQLPILAILGGTGKEGPGLALRWASVGYSVIIGSRQKEKAETTASELNTQLGLGNIQGMENAQAALQADICILTVVQSAHQEALKSLKNALQGKILVDATARVDFRDVKPPVSPAAARSAQDILGPGVRVVAAFQNVPAHALRKNLGQALDTHVLVCSDDKEAAEAVINLAQAGGMQAYYAGGLDNAVIVEGLTALLISINKFYGTKTASIAITGVS
jgi:8-hydroxy-5-deazaflavin:NADPH oxidoreductase